MGKLALTGGKPHNGNLSPAAFEAAITERTKAVIPVHGGEIGR